MGAMSEEMESLHKNSVWELILKPKDPKIIGSKWTYRKKENKNEKVAPTYKARLVAKEFSQKEGIDYNEIFFLVVKHTLFECCYLLWFNVTWSWINLT